MTSLSGSVFHKFVAFGIYIQMNCGRHLCEQKVDGDEIVYLSVGTFIFQLSAWAIVALSCFAQLHQIQSLDDHGQHQGAHFHKHHYHYKIDMDGRDCPKWKVTCLIFWTGYGIRLSLSSELLLMPSRHKHNERRYNSYCVP